MKPLTTFDRKLSSDVGGQEYRSPLPKPCDEHIGAQLYLYFQRKSLDNMDMDVDVNVSFCVCSTDGAASSIFHSKIDSRGKCCLHCQNLMNDQSCLRQY
jgi:hypothetical protein